MQVDISTSLPEFRTDCSETTRHSLREGWDEDVDIGCIVNPPFRATVGAAGGTSINAKVKSLSQKK